MSTEERAQMSEQTGRRVSGGEHGGAEVEFAGDDVERPEPTGPPVPDTVAEPIPDPGVEPDVVRLADVDPKFERRAERQVAGMFGLSALLIIGFVVAFVIVPIEGTDDVVSSVRTSNLALGLTLGLALLLIGTGAIHWAKKLMPDHEVVHERHELRSTDEVRAATLAEYEQGAEDSGFGRRRLIRNSLIGAMLLLPLPAIVLLRDLGPLPGNKKAQTLWARDVRVMTDAPEPRPLRPSDFEIGSLVNAMPETFEDLPEEGPERLNARAKSPVIVVRMLPEEINAAPGRENWSVEGILAYSKICTHVGCPINLYEQTTHNLLCPCHQSMFDIADNGKVIFGPAARNLPQLPLAVDDEGYLVSQSDFTEPVGPSYWERG
ncbi:MAG TPA: Rieske 2Fe-2S domain-containing protein [Jiangellaceae bacterium]|nr:Rieske 2Fe-2S domain-containing protein [Jiangellaceae bacterium]